MQHFHRLKQLTLRTHYCSSSKSLQLGNKKKSMHSALNPSGHGAGKMPHFQKKSFFADAGPVGNGILMNLQTSAKNRSAPQKRRVIWSHSKIFLLFRGAINVHFISEGVKSANHRVLSALAHERV
jgi:hypothetical protein